MKTNGNAETAGIEKPRQHNFLRLWGGLVQRTFPFMEEEVGELGPKAKLFVTVCETVVKPEWLTPLVEWEWWSNFMPWLILVQVKGAMAHPVYQVVASVRLKVPWASHGRQFTKNSVTPPLLLHQSCLTLGLPS